MDSPRTPSYLPVAIVAVILGLLSGAVAGGLAGYTVGRGKTSSASPAAQSSQTLSVQEDSATTDVAKKVAPAVVSIIASKDYSKVYQNPPSSPFDIFGLPFDFNQPDQPQGLQKIGGGTGFIVKSDGTIVTNKHVVEIAGADEFRVVLNDERTFPATIVAKDPTRDIAIIKIDAKDLPTVELGDSSTLEVGQTVIAIGNALGEFRNTATKGIISGLARSLIAGDESGTSERIEDAIQTDAAINRGNSGGPLLNLKGQAIGVNTAVSQAGQNIGFAIPIKFVSQDLESVTTSGKIVRPFLGVCYSIIDKDFAKQNSLPVDDGALIKQGQGCAVAVVPGSPADKAGIVENDIILEIAGVKVTTERSLAGLLADHKVGEVIEVKLYHKGEQKTVSVTLEERKDTTS